MSEREKGKQQEIRAEGPFRTERCLRIGSRDSRLARIQAELIMELIRKQDPSLRIQLVTMKTTGDLILDRTLDKIGGKGLFVRELDQALRDGRIDLAVHSLKDMPAELPEDLPIVAYSKREDPRDALVLPAAFPEAPDGGRGAGTADPAVLGSSSARRAVQLKKHFEKTRIRPVRGNVQTRIAKLDRGEFDGIVLACAGLKRLGLEGRISRIFSPEEILPAAGQGILAVQARRPRTEEERRLIGQIRQAVNDRNAEDEAAAERAFIKELDGGCSAPVAAFARAEGESLCLKGLYCGKQGTGFFTGTIEGSRAEGQSLGRKLAERLKRKSAGRVFLVGAGPGDPGLLTVRAAEVLERADTVVYDALTGDSVLSLLPPEAKTIYVGKRAGNHSASQEEINRILLEEAQKGRQVVRLKGGDPFLLGRGGEEAEALAAAGISFEVVPGVSSALAVPAFHGIPVTHRDWASSVHIITGHAKSRVDGAACAALAKAGGTLVFLMGIRNLENLCRALLEGGLPADTPAAVLENGTTAKQRRIGGTLGSLPEAAGKEGAAPPGILIVGEVCRLAGQLDWASVRPLAGWKIAVTRPRDRCGQLARMLREQGAEVCMLPSAETVPLEENPGLDKALDDLVRGGSFGWIVFTSSFGADLFFRRLARRGIDVRRLGPVRIAAVGPATRKAIEEKGLLVDCVPPEYNGRALGEALARDPKREKLLILRAAAGTEDLLAPLKEAGMEFEDIPLYGTETGTLSAAPDEEGRYPVRYDETFDAAVFASASAVRGFAGLHPGRDLSGVLGVCIGPRTAEEAARRGIRTVVAKEATLESLVEALTDLARQGPGGPL